MAITNVIKGQGETPIANYRTRIVDIDGLTSYTTGGQAITAQSLGLKKVFFAFSMACSDASNFTAPLIAAKGENNTSLKLMWFVNTTGAEVANGVNLSSKNTKLMVFGY